MKFFYLSIFAAGSLFISSCNQGGDNVAQTGTTSETSTEAVGQSGVQDDVSNPNIVQVASGSKDHTTLVTAVKAAGLADALSNAGPFTVFAPTNAAFDKLPEGTVEGLLKPEKKDALENILGYHTYVGVIDGILLQDGAEYDMVFGGKVKITKDGEKTLVNGSEIVATIKASNGVIHVIGDVLLPK
ncbi:MAG TPA: fasciclin domain-containing protein [Bacteroidia bacterium]|nr:fasciclin domain-containing protein [Bacteroidia bacterium]